MLGDVTGGKGNHQGRLFPCRITDVGLKERQGYQAVTSNVFI